MDHRLEPGGGQFLAGGRGAAALPADGGSNAFAGGLIPQDDGFSLIGKAYGEQSVGREGGALEAELDGAALTGKDLLGVLLHPAWAGIGLGKFHRTGGAGGSLAVEEHGAGAGGALVEGEDMISQKNTAFLAVFSLL